MRWALLLVMLVGCAAPRNDVPPVVVVADGYRYRMAAMDIYRQNDPRWIRVFGISAEQQREEDARIAADPTLRRWPGVIW